MSFLARFHALPAAALGLALFTSAAAAHASPESDAKDLFARARDLRAQSQCATASPLFAKAWRLYPEGLGSLRNLAECEEELRHYAAARRSWLDLKRALNTKSTDPRYEGWDADATEAAARLRPRVATMVVDVQVKTAKGESLATEATGVELFVDGEALGKSLVSTPIERDVGLHRIRVVLADAEPVEQNVVLGAGENPHVVTRLVVKEPTAPVVAVAPVVVPVAQPIAPPAPPPDPGHPTRRAFGYVLASAGLGALVGSAVTFTLRSAAQREVDDACPTRTNCPESLRSSFDRGHTMSMLTNVLLPVGAVGMVGGLALVLSSRGKTTTTTAKINVAPGGVGVSGSF